MKKYEAYKDSGIAWIGMIPEGWETLKMKSVFSVIAGATPDSSETTFWDGDIVWVTPADFKSKDHYISEGKRFISQKGYESCATTIVPAGSIVVSKRAPIGSVVIARKDLCTNQGCLSFVPTPKANSNFYYYALSVFTEALEMYGTGTTFKEISAFDFSNFRIPYPTLAEQQAIADYLDYKVGQIDTSVAEINTQIEDLKAYRQAVISEAVTKGLNPNAPMKDSGIEWIGMIPEGWSTSKVKYEVNMVLGKMLQSVEPTPNNGEYTLEYYLKSRNIGMLEVYNQEDQLDKMWFNSQEKDLYELKAGDLVMNEGGDIGKVSMWRPTDFKCYIQNSVHKLTPGENLVPEYLQYLMAFTAFKGYFSAIVSAISIAHLTKEKLADTPLILPPLPEQQAIADYLDEKTSKIDTAIKSLENQRDDLNALRQTVISEAVTGKIDLRDWKK
jgi:type I restriction enzyme S subunit